MFASFLIIVLLAAGSFGPIQALDYLDMMGDDASLGGKDLDEEYELAWKCTSLVFCDLYRAAGPIHGGCSMESDLEPGTLRPQSRDLATRPPRPHRDQERRAQGLKTDFIPYPVRSRSAAP
ncbi:hypothetical protein AVEN_132794-1 [Araneus ventricosus]|uniref:Uncharacterized protein n=1 Tax=Araneus ventricosus TaxID=182803 RepID=A0A4Y2S1U2_ARAVE|nr:hypothetical protein AVEN_132794-1 [Araneus ventricosus]